MRDVARIRSERGRFRHVVVVLTFATASVFTAAARPPADGGASTAGDPELGPLIAGRSSYVAGTHVWTDYAYDDTGPNSDGRSGGDADYPDGSSHNGADLIQLHLGTSERGHLEVTAILETLIGGEEALLGVGFDTDRNPNTGAATVPGARWSNTVPLGLEVLLLLGTDGEGQLRTWNGEDLGAAGTVPVQVDRARNVVSAVVGQLSPRRTTWKAVGVVGIEAGGDSWATGGQPIQDLAYVHAEDPTSDPALSLREQVPQLGFVPYPDKIQSDVLAGTLPPHHAVTNVEFGSDRHELAAPTDGYNTFLYHSRVDLPGEGVGQDPMQYRGPYMPYGVLIPPGLDASPPMVVFLHGLNAHHRVNPVLFMRGDGLIDNPFDVPAVVIFPNGRDTGWGTALAEKDALDATADAIRRIGIDRNRVVLSGISSGGIGTFRIAARWPDLWTGAYSLVGGGTRTLENLTNVRFRASNGALDPLVNLTFWYDSAAALDAAGTVDYRIALVHNRSHDGPLPEGNCYFLDLLSRPRVRDPGRVRYTIVPDEEENRYLTPRGAYWVSGMRSRDGGPATADVTSLRRRQRVAVEDISRVDQNVTKTADFCGPHPTLRGGNNWDVLGRRFATTRRRQPSNAMEITLTNLAAATIDVDRAGLSTGDAISLTITSDGATRLSLAGSWAGRHVVLREGDPAGGPKGDVVGVDVVPGTHTYTVRAAGGGRPR